MVRGKCVLEARVIVPPVDEGQRLIVDRLEPVFHQDKMVAAERCKKRDLFRVNAVRPRADGKADNAGVVECLPVEPFEDLNGSIGVRVRLEVDNELLRAVT